MAEDRVVIPSAVFWERKVDKYIQLWQYGGCSNEEFQENMVRMGYEEEIVADLIYGYNTEE
jgi:hypothetical protein